MTTLEVTSEMRERGLHICQEFLGGTWATIDEHYFKIERIKGGLSNLMYKCSLSDDVELSDGEKRTVLLRLYGQILSENPETVVTDSVIFAILAEKANGPKLYGVFTGGRVEEYVKSHTLSAKDLQRHSVSMKCAKIMGNFHKLTMPLPKCSNILIESLTRWMDDGLNNISLASVKNESACTKLQKLLAYNLPSEFEVLKKILSQIDSPVVFCHNDLNEGNILYKECKDIPGDFELVPIDFEYASYNSRGFDIANHFCEWIYDYHCENPPYFTAKLADYPTTEQCTQFCQLYLETYYSDGEDHSAEMVKLMNEVEVYVLLSHFYWGIWGIIQDQISSIRFGHLEFSLVRFDHYFIKKKSLLDKNIVKYK